MSSAVRENTVSRLTIGAVAALGVTGVAIVTNRAARADVTVVSTVTQDGKTSFKETTYYKGHRLRVDPGENNAITIFDGDANKMHVLNSLQKTYFAMDSSGSPAAAMMAMLKVTPTIKIAPTGAPRTSAGQMTHEHRFDANIEMSADGQAISAMSGGAPAKGVPAAPLHTDSLFRVPAGYKVTEGGTGLPPGAGPPGTSAGASLR